VVKNSLTNSLEPSNRFTYEKKVGVLHHNYDNKVGQYFTLYCNPNIAYHYCTKAVCQINHCIVEWFQLCVSVWSALNDVGILVLLSENLCASLFTNCSICTPFFMYWQYTHSYSTLARSLCGSCQYMIDGFLLFIAHYHIKISVIHAISVMYVRVTS